MGVALALETTGTTWDGTGRLFSWVDLFLQSTSTFSRRLGLVNKIDVPRFGSLIRLQLSSYGRQAFVSECIDGTNCGGFDLHLRRLDFQASISRRQDSSLPSPVYQRP